MKKFRESVWGLALALLIVSGCNFYYAKPNADLTDSFDLNKIERNQISWPLINRTIFTPHCTSCHRSFGTYLKVKQALSAIEEEVIINQNMPPSDAEPLPSVKIELLKRWIEAGAPEQPLSTPTPSPTPSEAPTPLPSPDPTTSPTDRVQPTFTSIHDRIFVPKCLNCHSSGGTAAKVPLNTLTDLLDSPSDLVVPGTPEESGLIIAITRTDKKRMPPPREGNALQPEEIEAIRTWIQGLTPISNSL